MADDATGQITTTSLDVAEKFGKTHHHVMRDIRTLLETCPPEFAETNFGLSSYAPGNGRSYPMYSLTKDGLTMLAMGWTDPKFMEWKVRYIVSTFATDGAAEASSKRCR